MDLKLKTGSRPNPEWSIHWTLTGQTHLYGWVDVDGLRCRVTISRRKTGGRIEVGRGTDPPGGTYTVVDGTMQLASELVPFLGSPVTVGDVTTKDVLHLSEIPFVNMAEQSAWDEHYAARADVISKRPPRRPQAWTSSTTRFSPRTSTRRTRTPFFAGFGFRSHAELATDNDGETHG